VDVANQACNIVSNVNVYVDNELACTNTPCRLETAARSHVIYADAPGYPRTPAESVVVESGSVTLHKLQLGTGAETGVEVRTLLSGLTLSIDGKQVGTLPRRVPGLAPGEHLLRIEGGENYYPEERTVRVTENEISVLEPVTPKLKFGTLEVAASERLRDARVTINDKHVDVPYLQRLDASGRYHLVAQKNGYENFESWIGFDSNTPKQRVELQMAPKRESAAVAAVARAPRANIGASSSTATGDAFLNINSRPAAMVLLDGKPIGQTPRVGISVRPGAHAVIFVGPDGERRRLSANVGAGATKSVSVRF
jgi:serine/threonine-protein kinase